MSSVNRILEKRRKAQTNNNQPSAEEPKAYPSPSNSATSHANTSNVPQKSLYDGERQKTFQPYKQYFPYNPSSFEYSNSYMPFNLALNNKYRTPLSCFINPVNEELEHTERNASQIQRCSSCRAYMNYYNQVTKKGYRCFLCGRDNSFQASYVHSSEYVESRQPSYLVDGPTGIYNDTPPENVMIFLVDVSQEAFHCKMLSYFVMVLKDILSRQQFNQTQIHFYTYDEAIHEYDFSGTEVERTVLDSSIKTSPNSKINDSFVEHIRDKLFTFLDSLEEIAEKNTKHGSNLYNALDYVYENVKRTGGKIYILQANEAIIGQSFVHENIKPVAGQEAPKPKSILQTKNKIFFNRFVQPMLVDNISMSFFIFGKSYKNIRVYSDTCKLTNSELMYYTKDNPEDINKFYYEFYNILSATYYIDTRIQLVISAGWYYTAVYGNLYRLKEHISFKFCHLERSKKICALFLPQEGFNAMPYFSMQIITNYIYGRKHYMSVNTAVVPFTTSLENLFENTNHSICSTSLYKSYLSALRLEEINGCRNKYVSQIALIYKAAMQFYKGKIPAEFRSMFLGFLGFLKNYHSQVQIINDTLILQKIISQRNVLQSCSYLECTSTFCPYLFDLTSIGNDRCLEDNFVYPDTVELRFSSVKEGLFLMDAGSSLFLYVSKSCHENYLYSLFGKAKLSKNDVLNEQLVANQTNEYSQQVMNLVRTIRESKTYSWAPLYIVRCGENSLNEKNFYLNFYEEKYDEFHGYKMTYDEFLSFLSKKY